MERNKRLFRAKTLNNFIEIYDIPDLLQDTDLPDGINLEEFINVDTCKNIIEYFESNVDKDYNKNSGLAFFNKKRNRICAGFSLDFSSSGIINDSIFLFLNSALKLYTQKYKYLKTDEAGRWRLTPLYNLQRYDGEEEGYFTLHHEHTGQYPYRMLAWMIYLNDAECGTVFPHQEKTITPKVGRTVIWPATWTHPHKGVTPNIGIKYIATGWYYFLPVGEPQFDGHHPHEARQEIVV